MLQPPDGSPPSRHHDPELLPIREVLARTIRFLEHCTHDPKAAVAADDPRELIRALEDLRTIEPHPMAAQAPTPPLGPETDPDVDHGPDIRTLPLRHRRSA